jgi:uncharacterized membrane protein
MLYLAALLLGIVAGLRAVTPIAAVSWAAYLGWLDLSGTWAGFLGNIVTVIVLSILAIIEYVGDQLPTTPSRKSVPQFAGRIILGGAAGLVVGLPDGPLWIATLILGVIGAIIGTLGGYEARRRLATAFGRDLPAGLLEDVVAIVVGLLAGYFA